MSIADEIALEKYPVKVTGYVHDGGTPLPYDANVKLREAFIEGFRLAEQDCKMTWHKVEPGYEYPVSLVREMDENGDYHYCISYGRIADTCEYLSLAEIELKTNVETI